MKKVVALIAALALGVSPALAAAAPPENRPPDNRPPGGGGGGGNGGGGETCQVGVVLGNNLICIIR
ncbi:MAG TPA: hypothetical protein VHF58_09610 [Solirubrobacterales bacterium]|nr:hypothetical protein [Solirubrobacterales bacterium]